MPHDLAPGASGGTGTDAAAPPPPRPSLRRRLLRGPAGDPPWARPALLVLLGATALLYLWGLGASGYANDFYAAAVQAGTKSWRAFFFGSLDSSSFITVDKPPASLWVMALSGRIFGFSSWSMLAPQALEGVAAVGVLYAAVRRWFGPVPGLLAGAGFALTPVAALMFRFNNPDALLTLLLVIGAYCVVRATEVASTRWLLLAGAAVGFGFLTKMLQAVVVVPVFGLVYLIAAPTSLGRRIVQLLGAAAATVAAAGWWVAAVELWPKSSRPFIGGSTTNSVLQLAFGYNGFSRILGNRGGGFGGGGGGPGGGGGGGFGGAPGWTRLFNGSWGGQIAWLIPAALIAFAAGLWLTRRAPRTDRVRAAVLLWGGWLLITAATFSFASGIVHEYYAVALAPAVGALIAIVGVRLWQLRGYDPFARLLLAAMVAAAGACAFVLLNRTPAWHPGLRVLLAVATVVAVAALLLGERIRRVLPSISPKGLAVGLAAVVVFAVFGGSAASAQVTAATAHSGSIPLAGPSSTSGFGFGGFGGGGGGGQFPGVPGGGGGGTQGQQPTVPFQGGGNPGGNSGGGGFGGGGANSALVSLLKADAGRYTWAAATVGSQSAAPLELASGQAVMAIGGFSGGDQAPTLAQFQQDVANHKIHYFVGGGRGGGFGGPGGDQGTASQITAWVASNFASQTVGGETVYDLTRPNTASTGNATSSSA